MTEERLVRSPLFMPEILTNPPTPKRLPLVDRLLQSVSMLVGMRGQHRRLLKVDDQDRLLTCPSGDEANRITQTRYLAAGLPAIVTLAADTVSWAVATTGGGVELDLQDVGHVSYGAFTIQTQGVWEMHHLCDHIHLTASVWTAAACTHVAIIEWRRA